MPRIVTRMEEADGPGGDFSCTFETGRGRLQCFVGDVTGHGSAAAGFRIELVARLEALALAGDRPASILAKVNEELESTWPSDVFACIVCVDIDLRRRRAAIAVAGHLPPMLIIRGHARVVPVVTGPPVGIFPAMGYVETELRLERDTLLVIATDGFGDAHMSELDPLGLAGLMRSIDRGPREPDRLCSFLFEAAGRGGFKDDATVVAMNICLGKPGGGARSSRRRPEPLPTAA